MPLVEKLKNFYKEPESIEPLSDKKIVDSQYKIWRIRIFIAMFLGYIVFYLCRKNISAAIPQMQIDLNLTNTQLGLLGSSLYLTYAIGKFVNGIIADNTDVKKILPTALIISALANICFVISSIFITPEITFFGLPAASILFWMLAFFWGVNGWFQSMGFPPMAKNLSYWFSNSERGFKWSLWSSSHEIGTFLAVIISGFLVVHFGWESAFYVPAIFALLFSIYLYKNLQDKPSSLGLPEIETYRNEVCVSNDENIVEPDLTYFEIFKKYILKNFQIWLLAVAYIFVYVVRYSTVDWIVKYLVDIKSYSIQAAAVKLSFLPLFGVIGTISAGFVSDKFFKGKRAPVNILCLSMLAAVLYLFKINTISYLDYLYIALIGIFTCGPQVLIGGLCAVESSSKKVASAATGFCGMFGYLGAVLSGVGTGFIIDKFGWSGALNYWVYCALIAVFICILLLIEENKKC